MFKTLFLGLAATVASVASMGICYDTYDYKNIDSHFSTLAGRFSTVRTFQTYIYSDSRNVIDAASDHGLGLYAGVWIRDGMDFNKEIQAVIDGYKRHPNTVKAVFVGNEDLENGWNQWQVIEKVKDAKSRFKAAGVNVRVGSVQTDGGWLRSQELYNECDLVGVNIYEFFGGSHESRWDAVVKKYGGSKLMITETGWPFGGGNYGNQVASYDNAVKHFNKIRSWMSAGHGGEDVMYFMFHDNKGKSPDYEKQFGLADASGKWKFDFSGAGPAPQPNPQPSPSPAPQPNPSPSPQPNPSPAPQPNPSPAPAPPSDKKCGGVEWNTDYPGNDMFNFAMAGDMGSLMNKCCGKCLTTSGCAGFAILDSRCYIKSALGGKKGASGVTTMRLQ